jgi:peptidyl-prolyl cis-trans isomerase D
VVPFVVLPFVDAAPKAASGFYKGLRRTMMSSVRRLSKSTVGTAIMILFLLTIAASFALQDMQNVSPFGSGMSSTTLGKAGNVELTEQELSKELQNRLTEARQQNPTADYSVFADDFDSIVDLLLQQKAMLAFAGENDVIISKRLVDAEIARLPQARGLNGRFSQDAYNQFLAQIRMTDAEVRSTIERTLLTKALLVPATVGARVPVGVARPYAEMQLEVREADVALIPTRAFLSSVGNPTDQQVQAFYRASLNRYTVPEQRTFNIAKFGPETVANVAPTDKEIADYYQSNQATYGAKNQRVISQVVLPAKGSADQIAARLRSGTNFGDAARPLGYSASDISVGPQTKEQFTSLTSSAVANAAFADSVGANGIVGPIRSDLGWHVIKVDGIQQTGGKSLEQARSEISAKLVEDKRKDALADLVALIEDEIADGKNFGEAVAAAKLTATKTPPITAAGTAPSNPNYNLPAELAPVLRAGFEIEQGGDPIVETLPNGAGYALVAVDSVISAAPAPLASIRQQVSDDWRNKQASDRAKAIATSASAAVAKGQAVEAAITATKPGVALPRPEAMKVRRIQLAQMGGNVPPALAMMFSLAEGRSRMVSDPQGRGFIIVKVKKITPGDVTLQPNLISQLQTDFREALVGEYAEQFAKAMGKDVALERNDNAIAAARGRIIGGAGN